MTQMATRRMQADGYGRRRGFWVALVLIIVAVLVALDFGARAVAQRVMASEIESQAGLHSRPAVSIDGFPFLTQVAARNFSHVTIAMHDVPAGPVTLTSINADGRGIGLNNYAFNSGSIQTVTGTVLIGYQSLNSFIGGQLGGLSQVAPGAGIKLSPAGPDEVKATVNAVITSISLTWRVTRASGNKINLDLVSSNGPLSTILGGSGQNLTLPLPNLPLGLAIDNVAVNSQGITGTVSGHDVPFGS